MTGSDREFEPGDHFHLGGRNAEYLEVWVLSRSDAADYWDGNWLGCDVRISIGGFRARFPANFRTNEVESFAEEVRGLHERLSGSARFESMEGQLRLLLEGDGRGHIRCQGDARDEAGTGNLLKFELELDQTELFGTMVELNELLNRYPVRGSPAA
jgi:hypothetical protein